MEKIKILSFAVAVLLIISSLLTACGNSANTPTPSTDNKQETKAPEQTSQAQETKPDFAGKQLMVANAQHFWFDAAKPLFSDFEVKTGAKIVTDEVTETRLYDKLKLAMSANSSDYDVVMVDVAWLSEFAGNNLLEPLEPYFQNTSIADPDYDINDIVKQYLDMCKWQDKLVALPLGGHSDMLAYRKDLFESAGIKAPTTMDELYTAAKALTKDGTYGVTMRGVRGPDIVYAWLQFLYPFGGQVLTSDLKPVINSPEAVASLEFFVKLLKDTAPKDVSSYGFNEMIAAFQQGRTSMFMDADVPAFIENPDMSKVSGKVGYLTFPQGKVKASSLAGWTLAVPVGSKNKDLAFTFIQMVSSKQNEEKLVTNGRDPIRYSGFTNPKLIEKMPYLPVLQQALENAVVEFRPRIPQWPQLADAIALSVSEALAGSKKPQQALDEANAKIETILKDAGVLK